MYMCMIFMYEFVCVCVYLLSLISKLYTKKLGVLLTLETLNEQALGSNIFINTNINKFYFPLLFQSLHSNDISFSPLGYCHRIINSFHNTIHQ